MNFPPERILVSYDFSSRCREAWGYAQDLARRLGGAVEAVHVRDWLDPYGAALRDALPAAARKALEQAMAAQIPGVPRAGYHVAQGSAAEGILSVARGRGAGMIVLATEGREGVRRFAPGSAAEAVVREARVPVLTVHEGAGEVRSILVAVDPAAGCRRGLELAAQAAARLGARLTFMHVVGGRFAARKGLERLEAAVSALPERLRAAASAKVVEGEPGRRVAEESAAHDLVVLPLRQALGATAERILRYSRAPVLTVPEAA